MENAEMSREEYEDFMRRYGFPKTEAVKMADYAILDFGSYREAYEYYRWNSRFLRGVAYAGARKARRTFGKR